MSGLRSIVIVKGKLKNISPFIIGKGKGDYRDIEILKDEKGVPYIPASSFVGALKHHIEENYRKNSSWGYFWGNENTQSHFIESDLRLKNHKPSISFRDGVAIDNKRGIAREKAKFNYELVEEECPFELNAEIKVMGDQNKDEILKILKTCIEELKDGNIFIGAMTSKGFGRFKLEDEEIFAFDFPKDGRAYLLAVDSNFEKLGESKKYPFPSVEGLELRTKKDFTIDAIFSLKSSLIISSYATNPEEPDKVHIKSDGKNAIPGTSLKGAIRSRAEKIINTLGGNGEELLKKTFGWADPKEKYKSRVIVEESVIEDAAEAIQTRIKIDRFTGGTIKGALVEAKPIWHKDENINIKITLKDYEDWEAGLMLLVLKDLWTADLPIGGEKAIGRGVLLGKRVKIQFDGQEIAVEDQNGKLKIDGDANTLEGLVREFCKKIAEGGNEDVSDI